MSALKIPANNSVLKIAKSDVDTSNYHMSASNFKTKYLSRHDFLIMHVNRPTRSLSKKFSDLKELLVDISNKPDILAISETKLKDGQQHNYNVELDGFEFLKYNSTTNVGGTGIYINRIYSYNLVNSHQLNVNGCEDCNHASHVTFLDLLFSPCMLQRLSFCCFFPFLVLSNYAVCYLCYYSCADDTKGKRRH